MAVDLETGLWECVSAHLQGPQVSEHVSAPAFAVSPDGLQRFHVDPASSERVTGLCYAGEEGDGWCLKPQASRAPAAERRLKEVMVTSLSNLLVVFLDERPIGSGEWATVEWEWGLDPSLVIRLDGWAMARYADDCWYSQNRLGKLEQDGACLTLGPAGLYAEREQAFRPLAVPLLRPSALAERSLTLAGR